ncbi:MAG: NB-ARC domain-containing protein [Cyanobacteria bacterium J06643_5]
MGQRRGRGVVLTDEGWKKLENALDEWENQNNSDKSYTIEALIEVTRLDPGTISKVLRREIAVDRRTLEIFFRSFNLELDKKDFTKLNLKNNRKHNKFFCSEAPDVSIFYSRTEELNTLQKWIINDCCRLITLVGIGGIGKTSLSAKVVQNLRDNFEFTIWLSLRNAPSPLQIISNLLQVLSNGEEIYLVKNIPVLINKLIDNLQNQRCLIVFDNFDAVFCRDDYAGNYLDECEGYKEIVQKIAEIQHQSCLIITSREKPKEISAIEGDILPVRSLQVNGLGMLEVKEIFKAKGITNGSDSDWERLTINYGGNPLYLKFIASTVLDLFEGDIANFLTQGNTVFSNVRNLIEQQFNRLSELEKSLLYWFVIYQDAVDLIEFQDLNKNQNQSFNLLEILESLNRRSLIEKNNSKFSLQPVVMEYVTFNFIDRIFQEVISEDFRLFKSHALLKATSPDYIQDIQKHLIIKPILERLEIYFGNQHQIEAFLIDIVDKFRGKSLRCTGYAVGNIINFLSQLSVNISNHDFSHLNIQEANLQEIIFHNVDFSSSNFIKSTFTNNFGIIFSLAFSKNEELLVTGSIDGQVYLWKWKESQLIFQHQAHKSIVESVAFSSDNLKIASSSRDRSIKIWDVLTEQCSLSLDLPDKNIGIVKNLVFNQDGNKLFGYSNKQIISWDLDSGNYWLLIESQSRICSLSLSCQDNFLVFGCEDGTIHIWDLIKQKFINQYFIDSGIVLSVRVTENIQIVACSIKDKIVKVENLNNSKSIQIQSQSYNISLIDISCNGKYIATGSGEKIIKIWDINTDLYLQSLSGHVSEINAITFSTTNKVLATASVDRTVKIWDITTGKCLKTLQGRADFIHSVIFSSDNQTIISGSQHSINFWDIDSGQCISNFLETKDWLSSLIFNLERKIIACANIGNEDNFIRTWQIDNLNNSFNQSNQIPNKILKGHDDNIWSIDFNHDGTKIVSGSSDRTVKIWNSHTGQCLKTLSGHSRPVLSVGFSHDGNTVASCGGHSIIKLWNVETGDCFQTIQEKASYIIKFNSTGLILASGHTSGMIKLWNINNGECIQTLGTFGKPIISIAFSENGKYIAYGSYDGTVTVWDINENKSIAKLQQNYSSPWSIAFNQNSNLLAIGRDSEVIQIWDIYTGEIIKSFQGNRPLEKVNITGITGLTPATIASLKELGANSK